MYIYNIHSVIIFILVFIYIYIYAINTSNFLAHYESVNIWGLLTAFEINMTVANSKLGFC